LTFITFQHYGEGTEQFPSAATILNGALSILAKSRTLITPSKLKM
jgi:hypothetical protein